MPAYSVPAGMELLLWGYKAARRAAAQIDWIGGLLRGIEGRHVRLSLTLAGGLNEAASRHTVEEVLHCLSFFWLHAWVRFCTRPSLNQAS